MNKGAWLFLIAAGGYILFELSLLHRFGYRMESDHILGKMISADEAARRCDGVTQSQENTFQVKFDRLAQRIARELADSTEVDPVEASRVPAGTHSDSIPELSLTTGLDQGSDNPNAATAEEAIESQALNHRETIRALVATEGCDSKTMRTWRRQYTVYAGKP